MLSALCVKTPETALILQALEQRRGWTLRRDIMPSEHEHRTMVWWFSVAPDELEDGAAFDYRQRHDAEVLYQEDRRFGVRSFLIEGGGAAKAEQELREFLDFYRPEELFDQVHSEHINVTTQERLRALFMTTCLVAPDAHDPAYEQMLVRLLEDEDEDDDLAIGALMIAERLAWAGLREAVAARVRGANALSRIAGRVLETLSES